MTHADNRLRRRKAVRAVPPTDEDLARFARLVVAARKAALRPEGDTKALAKARRAVRGRSMPSGQATPGSPFDRLCRFGDRWPAMIATARMKEAVELAGLAEACAALLEGLVPAPLLGRAETGPAGAEPLHQREPRSRADIDG